MTEQDKVIAVLKDEIENANRASAVLSYSYSKCQKIAIKSTYTEGDAEAFEALTSRFARLCDLLLQKVWRVLFIVELEDDGSVRDRLNRAEKKGLIDDAETFIEMRLLRNRIAHDYNMAKMNEIYKEVLGFTPLLLDAINKVHSYLKTHKLL